MHSNLKVCVIGFGSIGKRHCQNLIRLGIRNITLFRTSGKNNDLGLKEIYKEDYLLSQEFDFVILSNPTAFHFSFLEKLIPRHVNILAEKPIASTRVEYRQLEVLLRDYTGIGMCAYNLRFHPCVIKSKEIINSKALGKIYSARFFVGQYLPLWRPEKDYRCSYSAKKLLGGGVLLDLIHEIDLACLLCGPVEKNYHAMVGKVSDLEIETEDLAEIHYQSTMNAFISIHLDYLVKGYSRYFEIIGENGRVFCDLFTNELQLYIGGNEIADTFSFADFSRNDMYLSLMEYYIKHLHENTQPQPSLLDGLSSLNIALMAKQNSVNYE